MNGLRRTAFYRALHRPALLMGGERELMLVTLLVVAGLVLSAGNLLATVVSVVLWFGLSHFLRAMARADPRMSKVYLRHLRYARYYPARSRPSCRE